MAEIEEVTVKEASAITGIKPFTMRYNIRMGKFKARKINGTWVVSIKNSRVVYADVKEVPNAD